MTMFLISSILLCLFLLRLSYNLPVYFVLLCNCSVLSIVSEKYENYNKINKKKKFKESLFLGFIIMHCSLLNNTCTFTNKKCHMSEKIFYYYYCLHHTQISTVCVSSVAVNARTNHFLKSDR